MSEKTHANHTALYLKIFGALAILTLLTVGISYVHLPGKSGILVGLLIACVKAGLVASIFMHLKWEKTLIYGLIGLTLFFAVFLFGLPMIDFAWTGSAQPADVAAQVPGKNAPHHGAGH